MASASDEAFARGNAAGRATRELLMVTAERMFAERGVHGVSLREIGLASGQKNNMVIPYHFGDRDGLVAAIYRYRSEALDEQRRQLLAAVDKRGEGNSVEALLRVLLKPHTDTIDDPDNHFLGLLARLLLDLGSMAAIEPGKEMPEMGAHHEIRDRIRGLLPELTTRRFNARYDLLFDLAILGMAVRKRGGELHAAPSVSRVLDEVVRVMAAGLRPDAPPKRRR